MPIAALVALLLLHLAICCPGPGLLLIRRLRVSPLERWCIAVALSLLLVGLGGFAIFALGLPDGVRLLLAATAAGTSALAFPDLRRLLRRTQVRDAALGYAILLAWSIVLLAAVRSYSGGTWYGDWAEHHQRTLFFLGALPADFRFLDRYLVTTRPPLMNALTAQLLWPVGARFELFQIASTALNLTVFFPCCLLAQRLAHRQRRSAFLLLTTLLALNPMFVQNATYSWTKLFAAAYVLLALACFLKSRCASGGARASIALASLSAACMVHWSAGPYALLLGGSIALACVHARRWRALAAGTLAVVAIAGPWFAWAAWSYGPEAAFGTTPTSLDARTRGAVEIIVAAAHNLWSTLVPHLLRMPPGDAWAAVRGQLHDVAFLLYLPNLFFLMGSVGGLAASRLAVGAAFAAIARRDLVPLLFWTALVTGALVLGVAVVIAPEPFGAAHICLLPLGLMGLALLAARARTLSLGWRVALVAGAALDFALGILLHFDAQRTDLSLVSAADAAAMGASGPALGNAALKAELGLRFLGDHAPAAAPWLLAACAAIALALLVAMMRGLGLPRPSHERNASA